MNRDDIVQALSTMTPEELVDVTSRLERVFAEKAESIYAMDQENNGRLAQPYADIAYMMAMASTAFTEEGQENEFEEGWGDLSPTDTSPTQGSAPGPGIGLGFKRQTSVDGDAVSANTGPRTSRLADITGAAKRSWGGW